MRSRFDVDEGKNVIPRFAPPWLLVILIVISAALLFFFFPKEQILKNIAEQRQADQVAKQYMVNLILLYPHSRKLQSLLARQNIVKGDIASAVSMFVPLTSHPVRTEKDWQALWLYYQILRIETYAQPEISYQRLIGLSKMKNIIEILVTGKLQSSEVIILAEDSLSLNLVKLGLDLYQRLITMPFAGNAEYYAQGAKNVLGYGQYKLSAQLYFIAEKSSIELANKRHYFIEGLKSLQSGNLLDEAMKAAAQNINGLSDDRETLLFLTRLSLAADRPDMAEQYMKTALKLRFKAI